MCGPVLYGPALHCEQDISEAIKVSLSLSVVLMWSRSSSLLVMSTDGRSLFSLDTGNHSSQLGSLYTTVTPHWPTLQQRKPNHCRGVAVEDLFSTVCPLWSSFSVITHYRDERWFKSSAMCSILHFSSICRNTMWSTVVDSHSSQGSSKRRSSCTSCNPG